MNVEVACRASVATDNNDIVSHALIEADIQLTVGAKSKV